MGHETTSKKSRNKRINLGRRRKTRIIQRKEKKKKKKKEEKGTGRKSEMRKRNSVGSMEEGRQC